MSVHKVQQDILQTIADLGRPSAPYVTDAEITDRLGLDLQEVQDHLKLLENKGYVESIKDRGSGSRSKLCFSTQLTALGRTVLREPDYEQRNASDRAESIAEVDYALTSPMRRILLAFVEVATQSDTMTVPYHSIVSVEESGAIDYYITNSADRDKDVVVPRLRGNPIESLARLGIVSRVSKNSVFLEPLAFKLARKFGGAVQPVRRVETTVRTYFDTEDFQQRHPQAYQRWTDTEEMLWAVDSELRLTTIGHLCRETMQEFVTELVNQFQPPSVSQDKARTVSRLKSILDQQRGQFGNTEAPFLDALVTYWGTVIDLIQRQEHGGQKEGQPIAWEDGRRVVFHTAIVMFEIDRALSSTR